MPCVGDLFDNPVEQIRNILLGGKWDKEILENKEKAAEDLYNRYAIQEIELIGDIEFESIEVNKTSAPWAGEPPITTKGTALRIKQRIKPNSNIDRLMSLPAGSSLNAKGDVEHERDYLVITLGGDDWNEEFTARQLQYGKNEIINQVNRRNEDIKMGNKRILDKINEIISGRWPQLKAASDQKSQLAENLKKLSGN